MSDLRITTRTSGKVGSASPHTEISVYQNDAFAGFLKVETEYADQIVKLLNCATEARASIEEALETHLHHTLTNDIIAEIMLDVDEVTI